MSAGAREHAAAVSAPLLRPDTPARRLRVAILCVSEWSVRNVAHSRLLAALATRQIDVSVVTAFPLETGTSQLPLLDAPRLRSARGKPTLDALLKASFGLRHRLASPAIFDRWQRRNDTPWQRFRSRAVGWGAVAGSVDPLFRWQLALNERITRQSRDLAPARQQLAELAPDLVVSTSSVVRAEEPYLLAARDLGIRTLGCILSFDNLTSRSVLPAFDAYAVWNERMRDQVHRFYGMRAPGAVTVTGTPQFDFHLDRNFHQPRETTLARLGLPAGSRMLLYAANSCHFTPSEPSLVTAFARRCAATPALAGHHIVVRLHPVDDFARWTGAVLAEPRIVLSHPWTPGRVTPDDQRRLVGALREADACITMASTMSLDAAVVDTPVVCVAFALPGGTEEDRFCHEVYASDHYAPIARSGGVRIAGSLDDLVRESAAYLADPGRDRAARAALVRQEVGVADGQAAERVADLIAAEAQRARHGRDGGA